MKLHPVPPDALSPEIFRLFQKRTPLLTAGDQERCNTMTIGWGQLGTLWNKPICTVYVRPERFTYQFMEANPAYTLSVIPKEHQDALTLCGTKSGRDMDKIKECGLTLAYTASGTPYFAEAELVLVCRKLYAQNLEIAGVIDRKTISPFYGAHGNWHRTYTGEVVEILQAEETKD